MEIYFDGTIYSWQKGGGVLRYCNELMEGLAKMETNKVYNILREPYFCSFPPETDIKSFPVKHYPFNVPTFLFKYFRKMTSPINNFYMERFWQNKERGIFHSTYYTTFKNLRIPQVLTIHDLIQEKFPEFFHTKGDRRFIGKKKACIEAADAIICVSQTTKKDLVDIYHVPEDKINVIYHGISKTFYAVKDKAKKSEFLKRNGINSPFLLFVGNRGLYKNFEFLARTYASWKEKGEFSLVVAGGQIISSEEEKLLTDLGIREKVKFMGYVTEHDLRLLYNTTSCFVYPSLYEGFGMPILEALSCNAKVLASNIPVFKEVGENRISYFDPQEETSLLLELSDLANSTVKEKCFDDESLKKEFSWEKTVQQTLEVYEKLVNSK